MRREIMDSEYIKHEIRSFFEHMGFLSEIEDVEAYKGITARFNVQMRGNANMLIGEYGNNLISIEYLIKRIINKKRNLERFTPLENTRGSDGSIGALDLMPRENSLAGFTEEDKFTLDINDYRLKRLDELKQDIKTAAKEVRLYHREAPLRPMSSFERRLVHLLLAEYPDITTQSIGQDPNRRVIIKPYP